GGGCLGAPGDLPLSYGPIGLLEEPHGGHRIDEALAAIGHGRIDFDRAAAALRAWQQFDIGWVAAFPPRAPIEVGTVVAVVIRHFGFWSVNGCRIVYRVGDDDARFGFAHGALTNHAEAGEELFEVF